MIGLLGLDGGQSFALRLRNVGDLAGVPAEHRGTMQRIWARTEQLALTTMQLCTQVLRLQGPDIESLISATYDRCVLKLWQRPAGKCLRAGACWEGPSRHGGCGGACSLLLCHSGLAGRVLAGYGLFWVELTLRTWACACPICISEATYVVCGGASWRAAQGGPGL